MKNDVRICSFNKVICKKIDALKVTDLQQWYLLYVVYVNGNKKVLTTTTTTTTITCSCCFVYGSKWSWFFVLSFFCLLLFEGTFTSFLKIKSPKKSQNMGIKVFSLVLLDDRRIRIRVHTSEQWIRIRETQKHVDPVDPDPEHWLLESPGAAAACRAQSGAYWGPTD